MDRILDNLYLGGVQDAHDLRDHEEVFWGVVSVHERPANVPDIIDRYEHVRRVSWLPIMEGERGEEFRAKRRMLDAAAEVIHHYYERDQNCLVHCGSGIERGPLTMAWYLSKFQHCKNVTKAYDLIEEQRPQIQRRYHWLDFDE